DEGKGQDGYVVSVKPNKTAGDERVREQSVSNGRHASWQNCREEGRRPRSGKVESQQEHCGDNQDHEGPVAARLGHGRCQYRCVPTRTRSSELNSSTQRPDPRTTERKGSSATRTGTPSSWRMRSSSPRSNAPPPVSTMPRSRMSPESSGGHTSSGPDQLDDLQHRSLDRAAHFWRGDGDRVGQPGREVASCDPDAELLPQGECRAGADLDVLGASLTQQEGVLAHDVADDRLVDLVATQA